MLIICVRRRGVSILNKKYLFCYSAESKWPGLVNAMSGLVCAHLNDIGPPSTYQPHYSFQPQGAVIG